MENVYRVFLAFSVSLVAVSAAPQDQLLSEDSRPQQRLLRESPLESGPGALTIAAFNVENPTETNISSRTDSPRYARDNEDSTYETTEAAATEKSEELTTELNEIKPRFPSPRYTSKLSYFKKSEDNDQSALRNFLERSGKRKFRSRCRCEKIWNCQKLQISVARCPDEYFLCCF